MCKCPDENGVKTIYHEGIASALIQLASTYSLQLHSRVHSSNMQVSRDHDQPIDTIVKLYA